MSKSMKYLFIGLGTLATAIGIIGMFYQPPLPNAGCFPVTRSSERFLNWLLTNKLCGS